MNKYVNLTDKIFQVESDEILLLTQNSFFIGMLTSDSVPLHTLVATIWLHLIIFFFTFATLM